MALLTLRSSNVAHNSTAQTRAFDSTQYLHVALGLQTTWSIITFRKAERNPKNSMTSKFCRKMEDRICFYQIRTANFALEQSHFRGLGSAVAR